MAVYRGTAPLKAYRGDMQPVNVYKGSTKVAGWHSASYSGTSPLTVDCDYNVPPDALTVDGRCVQTGAPSPDSHAPITTITGDVTITGADGAASDTATVAMGDSFCGSLPDGTHDSYDAVTGVLIKRVGKVVLDGSADEGWIKYSTYENGIYRYGISGPLADALIPDNVNMTMVGVCDRFPTVSATATWAKTVGMSVDDSRVFLFYHGGITGSDVVTFKAWLAANPTTAYYKLATPTTIQLTPHLPVVRTGIKTLAVGADVVPTLSATVKSMD